MTKDGEPEEPDVDGSPHTTALSDEEREHFEELLDYLKRNRGFDFTGYKRASLVRRVSARMKAVETETFREYLAQRLKADLPACHRRWGEYNLRWRELRGYARLYALRHLPSHLIEASRTCTSTPACRSRDAYASPSSRSGSSSATTTVAGGSPDRSSASSGAARGSAASRPSRR